jgi:hypothetical protein
MKRGYKACICLALMGLAAGLVRRDEAQSSPASTEAAKVAENYWRQYLMHCGESTYLLEEGQRLIEYRQAAVEVKANPLNEADKLNGVEWRGLTFLRTTVERSILPDSAKPTWSPWNQSAGRGPEGMSKVNGKWTFTPGMMNRLAPAHDCGWIARVGDGRIPGKTITSYHLDGCPFGGGLTKVEQIDVFDVTLTDVNLTVTRLSQGGGPPEVVWFWHPVELELANAGASSCAFNLWIKNPFPDRAFANNAIALRDNNASKLEKICRDIAQAMDEWDKKYPHARTTKPENKCSAPAVASSQPSSSVVGGQPSPTPNSGGPPNASGGGSQKVSFTVRHRHNTFFTMRTSQAQAFCSGTLTVSPDGTITYDCLKTEDPSGRCEHLAIAPSSLRQVKVAADGALHLATSTQGNFDFYGDNNSIKQAQATIAKWLH